VNERLDIVFFGEKFAEYGQTELAVLFETELKDLE
jgi:hypothetical protein